MSRIRVIEAKKKKKTDADATCEKDDVEKDQVKDLLKKIPLLNDKFQIHRKIGEGAFSSVFLATKKNAPEEKYAVKHLVPTTHPNRVAHELRCLKDIGGKNHVIEVHECLRHLDQVVFIMPYIPHRKFSEYADDMGPDELVQYMRALLTALRHVHSFGVIHRDVKPSNFLYDRERRRYALVDFGLAQHVGPVTAQPPPAHQPLKRPRDDDSLPGAKRMALELATWQPPRAPPPAPPPPPRAPLPPERVERQPTEYREPMPLPRCAAPPRCQCPCSGAGGVCSECAKWAPPRANRAGTQGFRPPEVLFKYPHQGTAVDMWAAGVVLASVLTGRYPFFRATDDMTALAEITALLGSEAMERTAQALGCRLVASARRRAICMRYLAAHLRSACAPYRAAGAPCAECGECPAHGPLCVCRAVSPAHTFHPRLKVAGFPDAAFSLCARLLEPDPRARITAAEALRHPFLAVLVA